MEHIGTMILINWNVGNSRNIFEKSPRISDDSWAQGIYKCHLGKVVIFHLKMRIWRFPKISKMEDPQVTMGFHLYTQMVIRDLDALWYSHDFRKPQFC